MTEFSDKQLQQLRLPISGPGFGLRSVDELAPLAYVAHRAEMAFHVTQALGDAGLVPQPPFQMQAALDRVAQLARDQPQAEVPTMRDPVLPLEAVVHEDADTLWEFYGSLGAESELSIKLEAFDLPERVMSKCFNGGLRKLQKSFTLALDAENYDLL